MRHFVMSPAGAAPETDHKVDSVPQIDQDPRCTSHTTRSACVWASPLERRARHPLRGNSLAGAFQPPVPSLINWP